MDNSVTSIEMLVRLFNHSLRKRGFTRAIHREMNHGQSSGILQQHFVVLGLKPGTVLVSFPFVDMTVKPANAIVCLEQSMT